MPEALSNETRLVYFNETVSSSHVYNKRLATFLRGIVYGSRTCLACSTPQAPSSSCSWILGSILVSMFHRGPIVIIMSQSSLQEFWGQHLARKF